MRILVLNCGSSSVKYKLFDLGGGAETVLASGIVEEVGLGSPSLTHKRPGRDNLKKTGWRYAITGMRSRLCSRSWLMVSTASCAK